MDVCNCIKNQRVITLYPRVSKIPMTAKSDLTFLCWRVKGLSYTRHRSIRRKNWTRCFCLGLILQSFILSPRPLGGLWDNHQLLQTEESLKKLGRCITNLEHNNESLGVNLLLCPFSRIIVLGPPWGCRTCLSTYS